MTSFDFDYYKPDTLQEAAACNQQLTANGKAALYYGGGTEIISMARAESIRFDAVIDLKGIPECNVLATQNGRLTIGSAVTLTQIAESKYFPLLCETVARIADHTVQGKLTLGGNLGGTIIYREAALPLMITNCRASILTRNGLRELPFAEIFDGRLRLDAGDFLVQVSIAESDINLPYNHVKRTKSDKIDYPLISLAANKKGGQIRAAISGGASVPVLLSPAVLNDDTQSEDARIDALIAQLGNRMMDDPHGSKEYRMFVLRGILAQLYENLKGA